MSSLTYTERASMLDETQYVASVPRLEHEANWAWNHSLDITRSAERAEPDQVRVKRHVLVLKATTGWELRELADLVRARSFVNMRPGARPSKDDRAAMESMIPARFMRSLFDRGLVYEVCPDDLVYAGLLAFARTHYGASDMRAARTMTEATIRTLAVRAGIEPATAELTANG